MTFLNMLNSYKKLIYMKKIIVVLTLLLFSSISFAQDVLTKKTGEDIQSKVLEVTATEIKYKKFDNLNGPLIIVLKSEVLMIRYENGTKDVFTDEKKVETALFANGDPFAQGQSDALKYYKEYKSAGTGTLVTSIFNPLLGLVPAIICSSIPPQKTNLDYPSEALFNNTDYFNGYTSKAKKIKQNKVWTNYAIGAGTWLIVVVALVTVFISTY